MLDFISRDVQKYMAENGLEFSDFEKATMIYHSTLPIKEKHEALENLAGETADETLKQQIAHRLYDDKQDMEAFINNTEGYVYVVVTLEWDDDGYISEVNKYGHFADSQTACAHGMTLDCQFEVEKFRIIKSENYPSRKIKEYTNLYSLAKQDFEEFAWWKDLDPQAGCHYRSDGTLRHFWSKEIKREDKAVPDVWAKNRFENATVRMLNPFEKGDIVRTVIDGEYGIVETSREEWGKSLDWRGNNRDLRVFLFYNEGGTGHRNLSPVELEKCEPPKDHKEYERIMAEREDIVNNPFEKYLNAMEKYKGNNDK